MLKIVVLFRNYDNNIIFKFLKFLLVIKDYREGMFFL